MGVYTSKPMSKQIHTRLKRVEGQVRSLAEQLDTEKCVDVITQFKAAKAALESAYDEYLKEHLRICAENKDTKTLKSIITNITKR